jgi:hypothetical protein
MFMNKLIPLALITLTLSCASGCKKEEASPAAPNTPATTNCNFTTDVVAVDGTSFPVKKYNCGAPAGSYLAEYLTDSSAVPTGLVFMFSGSGSPAAGDYAIHADAATVAAGQVYVEYYDPSTAWHGTAGTVHVEANGAARVFTFCSLTLNAGGSNNKTVSARGTCN